MAEPQNGGAIMHWIKSERLETEHYICDGKPSDLTGYYTLSGYNLWVGMGTYYVWFKVEGDDNHNDVDPKCVTATISDPTPMVATNKNMKDAQIINVESTKKSYVVSGLKKCKTYYVRVRPMKLRGDVEYVGILSNTCKVKVK